MSRQEQTWKKDSGVISFWSNRLAPETKGLLYNGLEKIANVGDSESEYLDIAKAYPEFWPLDSQHPEVGLIRWDPAAHPVFLVFRDYLRKVWVRDPKAHDDGYLRVLLGLDLGFVSDPIYEEFGREARVNWSSQKNELYAAWHELWKKYPDIGVGARPIVDPIWGAGVFSYAPTNDFQRAVYQLFLENWRAKRCSLCSRYFIAEKSAQIYCSTACSGGTKRERSRTWWNQKGSERRAKLNRSRKEKKGETK